jgi:hypothetical protein
MGFGQYYFRLQPAVLSKDSAGLDNASAANIQRLKQAANDYLQQERKTLDEIILHLLRERPRECQRAALPL